MLKSTLSVAATANPGRTGPVEQVPSFVYDGVAMTAIFPARLDALRAILPDPHLAPARLAPGIGVVGVSCFEYRDTDIGPYNQVAISIVLNNPYFCANLPGRALVSEPRQRQLDTWVHHLPVTTANPGTVGAHDSDSTFLASIDFTADRGSRSCQLAEGSEHILTLSAAAIPTPRYETLQLFTHQQSPGPSSEFKINAHAMGESLSPDAATLTLDDRHPIARELAGMLLQQQSLCYQYLAGFDAIYCPRATHRRDSRTETRSARLTGPASRRRLAVVPSHIPA